MFSALSQKNITEVFQRKFKEKLDGGAALALYHRGEKVISLHQGWCDEACTRPWQEDSLVLIWSAGKGVAAACLLHAMQEKGITPEEKITTFWPEFGQAGKENITIAQLLSHQAGLAALDKKGLALTDHNAVVEALAAQPPNWPYDGSHGYGARTFGFLLDELLRRISQVPSLAMYWRHYFADPFNLDLWFGLPPENLLRAVDAIPPKVAPPPSEFATAYAEPHSLTRRAFLEPGGSFSARAMNQTIMRCTENISSGAMSTAEALAKFYSLVAMKKKNPWFTQTTQHAMQTPIARGKDRVLLTETVFSLGLMINNSQKIMGCNPSCFGHPGAGGALGFADPEREIGFAFLPNAMHPGVISSPRTQEIVTMIQ